MPATTVRSIPAEPIILSSTSRTRALATAAFIALAAIQADAAPARAQTLRARLADADAGAPVSGAFVMLIDSAGVKAVGTLADSAGRLELRAPRPGSYTVRVERLGYETFQTGPYVLGAEEVVVKELAVPGRAIVLPAIEATAGNRCRGRADLSGAAAMIWGEVRKTLAVASWTSLRERYQYDVVEVNKVLDTRRRVVAESSTPSRIRNARSPFESLPAENLMTQGFVRRSALLMQWEYFGPDADVLQSDVFLDGHCFRPVTDRKQPALVGLAFEPSTTGPTAGIRGTLWIDRQSYALDHVDFTFDWLPEGIERDEFSGGRVDFRQLADGIWIVPSWVLRVPQVGRDRRGRPEIGGYNERSRQVTAAYRADGTQIPLGRR